jgi:hypothetical protein
MTARVANMYLPDKRYCMLPSILSDTYCSLLANEDKIAHAMVLDIDKETATIIGEPKFKNVVMRVSKNYSYDNTEILEYDEAYIHLHELTTRIDPTVTTADEVVAYWMIQMNTHTAKKMYSINSSVLPMGIFRTVSEKQCSSNDNTRKFIETHFANKIGKYFVFNSTKNNKHIETQEEAIISPNPYMHITSPIRRLVDLINQVIFYKMTFLVDHISEECTDFINGWLHKIDDINTSMRSIRKIQNDCLLMYKCFTGTDIINREHRGIIVDKNPNYPPGIHKYTVYLEELKVWAHIKTEVELDLYSYHMFNVFLFELEDNAKRKIKIQLK